MVVHIIGGGLAGLSAAVACADAGRKVQLYEAAPRLGGRCASWHDSAVDAIIDNGTHAVVAGNRRTMRYLDLIGAKDRLRQDPAGLRLLNTATGQWFSPWSVLGFEDVVSALNLTLARPGTVAGAVLPDAPSLNAFWEPLCTAVLNTPLAEADARLLARALRRMLFSFVPLIAAESLSDTYISPAETFVRARGGEFFLACAVTSLVRLGDRVTAFTGRDAAFPVGRDDQVIIALPPWSPLLEGSGLAPAGLAPSPIVNAHFRVSEAAAPRFVGLVGGTAQWLLQRGPIATVTVSAADQLIDLGDTEIAERLWRDVTRVLGSGPMPAFRVIKERRATIRHTPASQSRPRASARPYANLVLAGDWTDPALPCTIEAAIVSGVVAAEVICAQSRFR